MKIVVAILIAAATTLAAPQTTATDGADASSDHVIQNAELAQQGGGGGRGLRDGSGPHGAGGGKGRGAESTKNHAEGEHAEGEHAEGEHAEGEHTEGAHAEGAHAEGGHGAGEAPSPFLVIPFVVLLLMIATGPLFYHKFWDRHYPKVAIALGLITAGYYLVALRDDYNMHALMHSVKEYLSFIALLGSLFVASGGIMIKVDKKSTPLLNIAFLAIGSVIANVIGTTGASMLLIRPFIKINKGRIKPFHIVFFIFLVSNIGGALTPIGDPPLFLGFLRGVPFFWTLFHVWYIWIPTILVVLAIFYVFDSQDLKKHKNDDVEEHTGKIEFKGLKNLAFLAIILISVFLDPNVLSWVPSLAPLPFGIRELIMFAVMYFSYTMANEDALRANEFDFEPIKEVAFLFIGIFLTMTPALQLIGQMAKENSDQLNDTLLYWATGSLSAFLDNAPTYLNFLSAAVGRFNLDINLVSDVREFVTKDMFLQSISVAAVYFGAMTYIGNGPNFMVKSISERSGIRMPSFFGYMMKYSIPILLPIFIVVWFVFFK
jgi:Na+/H+ antiporter NhaD/arsenite permease-like protein